MSFQKVYTIQAGQVRYKNSDDVRTKRMFHAFPYLGKSTNTVGSPLAEYFSKIAY